MFESVRIPFVKPVYCTSRGLKITIIRSTKLSNIVLNIIIT